jgi:hypothetical protein
MTSNVGTPSEANTFSINYGARRVQGLYGIDAVRVGRPVTTGGVLANRSSVTVG